MAFLRRYGTWVLLVTVVVMVAAAYVGKQRSVQYSSIAQVDVEARLVTGTTPAAPNLATEKAVAASGAVLVGAAQAAGVPAGELPAHVAVTVSGTSNILSIGCNMPTAVAAQRCAAAVANSYVAFRNGASDSKADQARNALHVTLVTSAVLPDKPTGTKLSILLSLGAFLGIGLGVGSALVRDRFDDRVRDRSDLEQYLRAPVIATIPRVRRPAHPEAVFSNDPRSLAADAYRHLRVRLTPLISSVGKQGTVLLVTGAQPGEGRTCVAGNLAVALAMSGLRVLLVDADVRNPSLSRAFEVIDQPGAPDSLADQLLAGSDRPGLNQLLAGTAQLGDVTLAASVPGLTLLSAGPSTDRSADMFDTVRLSRVFAMARQAAHVVVVDSPAVLAVSDPIALADVSDVVLWVANPRRTRRGALAAAAAELRAVEPHAIVGVLNAVPRWVQTGTERHAAPRLGSQAAAMDAGTGDETDSEMWWQPGSSADERQVAPIGSPGVRVPRHRSEPNGNGS